MQNTYIDLFIYFYQAGLIKTEHHTNNIYDSKVDNYNNLTRITVKLQVCVNSSSFHWVRSCDTESTFSAPKWLIAGQILQFID